MKNKKYKLDYNFVKSEIERTGYTLLSTEYINNREKLDLKCPNNHYYSVSYSNFKQGKRCPTCRNEKLNKKYKKNIQEVKTDIEKIEGYLLISDTYINSDKKLEIRCPNGHLFFMSYKNFHNVGQRCPYCQNKKVDFNDVIYAFKKHGFILISTEEDYTTNTNKLDFICEKHQDLGIQQIGYVYVKRGQGCEGCFKEKISGENSHLWKGGITSENLLFRSSSKYKDWRTKVFIRDNYTCQCCGNSISNKLQVHHIDNFSDHEEKRIDIENGITLCEYCHDIKYKNSFHSIYGTRNNNVRQLIEYVDNVRKSLVVPIHIYENKHNLIEIESYIDNILKLNYKFSGM